MSFIAAASISAGGSILGGLFGSSAAKKAAKAQLQAAREQMALQKELYYDQVNRQEPFRQAGLSTTKELMRQFGLGEGADTAGYGNLLRDFAASDFQADPGYAFRLAEGNKALDRAAAARGGYLSGGALKAGQRYAQDVASQEYSNAYNRYNQNRLMRYNMLTGQQAVGQNATNAQGGAAQNYAAGGGQALADMGAARASGYVGSANALAQGLQGAGNAFENMMFMRAMFPGGSSGSPAEIQRGWNAWKDPLVGASVNPSSISF